MVFWLNWLGIIIIMNVALEINNDLLAKIWI
jgi:hypothetical protein